MDQLNHPGRKPERSSWSQIISSAAVTAIGFGFAIYRYLQYTGLAGNIRLSRLERPIYRLAGYWGLIAVFTIMGLMGLYLLIKHIRLRKR